MNFKQVTATKACKLQQSKPKKNYASTAEQAQYVKRWQESRLKQSAFCRQHNLNPKTFSQWIKKFTVNKNGLVLDQPHKAPGKRLMQVDYLELKLANGASVNFQGTLQGAWIHSMIEEILACKSN